MRSKSNTPSPLPQPPTYSDFDAEQNSWGRVKNGMRINVNSRRLLTYYGAIKVLKLFDLGGQNERLSCLSYSWTPHFIIIVVVLVVVICRIVHHRHGYCLFYWPLTSLVTLSHCHWLVTTQNPVTVPPVWLLIPNIPTQGFVNSIQVAIEWKREGEYETVLEGNQSRPERTRRSWWL